MPLRHMSSARSILTTFLLAALVACGGDDPAGPEVTTTGPVSARVDGAAWAATIAFATNTGGFVAVGASSTAGEGIGFALQGSTPGTYTFGPSNPANATLTIGSDVWSAGAGTGSGSIVITVLNSTRVAGTFSFQGVSLTGTPATRSITEGVFDVAF